MSYQDFKIREFNPILTGVKSPDRRYSDKTKANIQKDIEIFYKNFTKTNNAYIRISGHGANIGTLNQAQSKCTLKEFLDTFGNPLRDITNANNEIILTKAASKKAIDRLKAAEELPPDPPASPKFSKEQVKETILSYKNRIEGLPEVINPIALKSPTSQL